MHTIHVLAPAKVNLALRVGAPRDDGFHPLDTVFESVDLFDEIIAEPADKLAMSMEGMGSEDLPTDSSNLVIRAAEALRARAGRPELAARIHVIKRIPIAGGMAGGSADAAGTLVALNALWKLDYEQSELMRIGAALGSDVPFCLMGGLARGRGRGEELEAIRPGAMHCWAFLINPEGLGTPRVFREFDRLAGDAPSVPVSTDELCTALGSQSIEDAAPHMVNDLEAPALSLRPDLVEIMEEARGHGSVAILSGSGPSVAVLAEDFTTADILAGKMRNRFGHLTVIRANGPTAGAHVARVL